MSTPRRFTKDELAALGPNNGWTSAYVPDPSYHYVPAQVDYGGSDGDIGSRTYVAPTSGRN